jgi:AT-rich DNA-binding protein
MKDYTIVSNAVIKRLPRYRRILKDLLKKKVNVISSNGLGGLINFTASQVRQDLNNFGTFGLQGYGYNVEKLYNQINTILGLENTYKMVIVGTGNLGQAIANYTRFYKSGFQVVALFEVNPKLIGLKINDIEVIDFNEIDKYLSKNQIDIGIITTNKDSAQAVADKLAKGGVKGIWNFAAADLNIPDNIAVENVHLSDSLRLLAYHINQNDLRVEEKISS